MRRVRVSAPPLGNHCFAGASALIGRFDAICRSMDALLGTSRASIRIARWIPLTARTTGQLD
jgi:hypothetical protein